MARMNAGGGSGKYGRVSSRINQSNHSATKTISGRWAKARKRVMGAVRKAK